MYKIEQRPWGYYLIFGGSMDATEMRKWVDESEALLKNAPATFGVFVDMRTLKILVPEAQEAMQDGQKAYKRAGMVRSVVILQSALVTLQFKNIAKKTGIYEWERYIDASSVSDWERVGIAWVRDAKDPDIVAA